MKNLVSVIITTKNEQNRIGRCLASVKNQTFKHIECIVVDNNSTDKTKTICLSFTNAVFNKGPERSAQRNYGAGKAKGKYLLFLDADMELTPHVIQEAVDAIGQQKGTKVCRAIIIPERSKGSGFWSHCKILERMCYEGVEWMEAARFYDKKTFFDLGAYDESLTGPEDFDFSQRIVSNGKTCIGRIHSYIYHNEGVIRLGSLLRKKYYYGRNMVGYAAKKQNADAFTKQANPVFRYIIFLMNYRLLLADPFHAIGLFIMKTLETGSLIAGAFAGRQNKQKATV